MEGAGGATQMGRESTEDWWFKFLASLWLPGGGYSFPLRLGMKVL